jgi:N-acetylmuramoyl-L-alanine amidase
MKMVFKITQNLESYLFLSNKNYTEAFKRVRISSFIFLLFLISGFCSFSQKNANKSQNFNVKTIVLDAGHGGHDPGCLGSSSQEKHICLGIALKLGKLIQTFCPDVKVIYTRDKDEFVKLHERANIANKNKADLFISIHANSAQNKAAYGTETYVMGTKYTDRNLELSKRENSVILMEKDYEKNYDGYDPNSPMTNILMGLYQQEYLQSSINFAHKVEHQFSSRNSRHSRGVRQRVLLVMYRTTMPSVLIEVGFLSNSKNQKLLREQIGQAETAGAIFRAFVEYKMEMEGFNSSIIAEKEARLFANWDSTLTFVLNLKLNDAKSIELQKKVDLTKDSVDRLIKNHQAFEAQKVKEKSNPKNNEVLFRIQITSSSKKIPLNSRKFKDVKNIFEYKAGEVFKYAVGNCVTQKEALDLQKKVRQTSFNDAFVVAFYKGNRVSVKKAKELIAQGKQ